MRDSNRSYRSSSTAAAVFSVITEKANCSLTRNNYENYF
jgi:hypothetical protein